jgi:tetratricopeptide (TPR) repeat protein
MGRQLPVIFFISLVLCLQPLTAQRRNADREAAAVSQNPGPTPASRAEADAFNAIQNTSDPAVKLAAADKFASAYPKSQLAGLVSRQRMDAFITLGQYKDAIAAGEAGLAFETQYVEALIKRADQDAANPGPRERDAPPPLDRNAAGFKAFVADLPNVSFFYYQRLMKAAQAMNDDAKAADFASRAYAIKPDDLFTMLTLAQSLPDQNRAEEMARKAADQVTALVSSPTGAAMPAAQKADLLSGVHSTLGRLFLNQKRYTDSQKSYLAAIAARNDDPVLYMGLGIACSQQTPPKNAEAIEAFAKAVYLKGTLEAQARQYLEAVYLHEKKSLEGLDQFIQMAGAAIGR